MLSKKQKILFITFFVLVFSVCVVIRLFYIQVVNHDHYTKLSHIQSVKEVSVMDNRGKILDKKGNLIALDKKIASLFIFGRDIENVNVLSKALSKAGISLSYSKIKKIKNSEGFIWLDRGVSIEKAIKAKRYYSKINIIKHENRYYPGNETLAGVIGFTGVDNQGLYGIEYLLDSTLKSDEKRFYLMRDSKGELIKIDEDIEKKNRGTDVYLTVDMELQKTAELILKEDMTRYGAKMGVVAAMNVFNGELLFVASAPSFNPNRFENYSKEFWKNKLTLYLFEPGSIFKAVTFCHLFESGLVDNSVKVDCGDGSYRLHGHTINDVHRYKLLTPHEILIKSSNIGTVKLAEKSTPKSFYQFLRVAGFNSKSGIIGMPEEGGKLRDYREWSGLSMASLSMGQELMVTPLQMLRFCAAIANGGFLVKPKIIDRIVPGNEFSSEQHKRIFSSATSSTLSTLLKDVVEEGTGKRARSDFFKIAGKTGTAQKFDVKNARYSKRDYVASFVGFFPYENPKIAMVVIFDSPRTSIYGGSTAAITFRKIAEQVAIKFGFNIKRIMANYDTKKAS